MTCTGPNVAEREHGAEGPANHPRCRTVDAECTAGHLREPRGVTGTLTSMDVILKRLLPDAARFQR